MQNLQRTVLWAIITTEFSHIFCCVLPTLFSIATLLVTFGALGAMPVFMVDLHDLLHAWEIQIIAFSGFMISLGWMLHAYSVRVDCHDTGCVHEPCKPVKKRTARILKISSLLFLVNVAVYTAFHYGGMGLIGESLVPEANSYTHESHGHMH